MRLVIKPRDPWKSESDGSPAYVPALLENGEWGWLFDGCTYGVIGCSPYQPGDLLWVRKEVSKIWLKVEDIKVSRLQDITPWEAIQEGIESKGNKPCQFGDYEPVWKNYLYPKEPEKWLDSAVDSFRTLWDSINAKHGYGWDINPWVWRIEFKMDKQGGEK